ncbi:DUF3152 domain-containing protein [Streptomyces sp. NRRL B-1677]|uniref:DUF3152 domain-containing protein n=1 Tax=Streptomyces sp. NRRL B-1677 TaxID=2682966 RepID=UPI002B4ACA03|nr:DUF3152 domain-containing protein [Streptomyces sp. NRRL B-1677]
MGKHSARAPRAVSRPAAPAASGAGGGPGAAGRDATAAPQGESEGEPLGGPFGPAGAPGPAGRPGSFEAPGPFDPHGSFVPADPFDPAGPFDPHGSYDPSGPSGSFDPSDDPSDAFDAFRRQDVGVGWGVIGVQRVHGADTGTYGPGSVPDGDARLAGYLGGYAAEPEAASSPYWLGGAPSASGPSVSGPVLAEDPAPSVPSAPSAFSAPSAPPARVPAPRPSTARPRTGGSRGTSRNTGSPKSGGGMARTATGVAAAVVTAVLAVVVAGQVEDGADTQAQARPADVERARPDAASRSDSRPTPNGGAAGQLTYEQKMDRKYPLDEKAKGSGSFETVGGHDSAPGRGDVLRYRVDVEKGLPLDGELFATAVHRTLNDERSWGHGGTRTFERVSSGHADFVITLATPGTTAVWCAKSGLDTTEDNVSCDSAATDRVMINAYRWAQGAPTYGDKIHAYRQMLINHEVGHRLGHDHETCSKEGALAPVMMQQTKFLTTDGVTCRPNPWPHP